MKISARFFPWVLVLVIEVGTNYNLFAQAVEAGDGKSSAVTTQHLTVELVSQSPEIARDGTAYIGLRFRLQDHWHVYWANAGDAGAPPRVKWELPAGLSAGPLLFPTPSRLAQGPLMDFGYENNVTFPINITAGPAAADSPIRLDAHVQWLVCREVCIPGKAHLGLDLKVVPHGQTSPLSGVMGEAIQSLPKPVPQGMKISVLGGGTEFVITMVSGQRQDEAEFYPLDADQIVNAAPQIVEATSDGLRLHVQVAPELRNLPARLHGVLKIPGQDAFEVDSGVLPGKSPLPANTSSGDAGTLTVVGAIGFAFCGGLILNLMPCVFPVLFLKGLALVQSSREERSRMRAHGMMYALASSYRSGSLWLCCWCSVQLAAKQAGAFNFSRLSS